MENPAWLLLVVQITSGLVLLVASNALTWYLASGRRDEWELSAQTGGRWILSRRSSRPAYGVSVGSARRPVASSATVTGAPNPKLDMAPRHRIELDNVAEDDVLRLEWVDRGRWFALVAVPRDNGVPIKVHKKSRRRVPFHEGT